MLFFGQPGFNNPLSRSIVVENEAKTIVHSIIIDPDIVFSKKRQQIHNESWKLPRMYIKNLLKPDDLEIDGKICSEMAKNFKNYRERIIESNNSNKLKRDLSTEDQVLIKKKDFDMNTKTKRVPFDSFYDNSVFTVTAILMSNMIEVKNNDGDTRTVFGAVIKRV
ncbi:hypothetical protein CWI39_2626p0010 [Hamiltosporidium magnivora]|uniref:Uncharacterized protein n=1 Tax=Hamiltosporidium magnivora TaxID=148818 RepID=A0A4Q9KVF6_9MICR|nr:hypothetical protein CWI39_2626p0010 [Hamiltosporidium magnivora]